MSSVICSSILTYPAYAKESQLYPWIPRLLVQAAIDSARIWSQITGIKTPLKMIVFHETSVQEGLETVRIYMNELLKAWAQLRPILQKRALTVLTPADPRFAEL